MRYTHFFLLSSVALLVFCYGCGQPREVAPVGDESALKEGADKIELQSTFENGARIDRKYTGEGKDVSPPLSWSGLPNGTKSLALICEDPDAPRPEPWVHWVIYNIPATASKLPQGIPREPDPSMLQEARQGPNSWGTDSIGYRGPLPPAGTGEHRYFFRLYALDTTVRLEPTEATKEELLSAMKTHVLGYGELMGTYKRQ